MLLDHRCIPDKPCALCGRGTVKKKAAPVVVRKPLPVVCSHLSIESGVVQGSVRRWRQCNGGYGSTTGDERTGKVCDCSASGKGVWRIGHECGPTCPGYSPPYPYPVDPHPPTASHQITIGHPPPLTPTSERLVCTVAVGPAGAALLNATGPLMERYAHKVGADFFAFTGEPLNPSYPLGDKFRLHHLTKHYARLLFIDADAVIHPDLFAEVPAGVAIHDDAGEANHREFLTTAYRRVLTSQGETGDDGGKVLNSGVVLWGSDTPGVWTPPAKPLPADLHVAEQCWVQRNVMRAGGFTPARPAVEPPVVE